MSDRFGPPIEKGGINDPVAQSIRNEQMMDAMPAHLECDGCGKRYNDDWPDCPHCNDLHPRERS